MRRARRERVRIDPKLRGPRQRARLERMVARLGRDRAWQLELERLLSFYPT